MQKKLIALAIAGLSSTAFAQSNVTISGQIKTGYTSYKTSGLAANNGSTNSITNQTSSFVLSGSENLGNGLSAIFRIDNRFTAEQGGTATSVGDGNTHVGLKGNFGEIKIGRQNLHFNEQERIDAGVTGLSQQYSVTRNLLSGVGGGNTATTRIGAGNTRTSNVIFWDSKNFSGFTARVAYSTGFNTDADNTVVADSKEGNLWNLVARYENGPLKAGISHLKAETATTATNAFQRQDTSTKAWIGYALAGVNFGLAYDQSEIENATGNAAAKAKRTAWAIPVSYKTGNHGLYAAYAKAGKTETLTGDVANSGAKQWSLGYDYSLSKRTIVGVNYTKIDNNAASNYGFFNQGNTGTAAAAGALTGGIAGATNGATYSQLYAGVRHAF
ncbi:MAG: porin [Rhodocyclaceae bacterium]|nr:porin [Rhodocyclaceae bacterium]